MARKNLLKGLMEPGADAPKPPAPQSRSGKGAVGAVSRSIADLKARSVVELDPFQIEPGGMQDRLEADDADDRALLEAIREYGQQVPVLVRPHPENPDRYQIVYGRRRVLALRDLGQPVKALIRDLDDTQLIVAQGQENTARRDLSFIEKANFARQMVAAGYKRKIICDALTIDKTVISRMLALFDVLPPELIEAVGSAHGIGRGRWLALATMVEELRVDRESLTATALHAQDAKTSDARFEAVYAFVERRKNQIFDEEPEDPPAPPILTQDGTVLATVHRGARLTTLKLNNKDGFQDWLLTHLPELHRQWRDGEETRETEQ